MVLDDLNLQTLINEAEVYQSQGLLEESKEKYLSVLQYVEGGAQPSTDYTKIISIVRDRVSKIESDITEFEDINENPTLSLDVQNLIQKVFSVSQTKEMAEVEGVLALAKFGQYEQALEEFYRLLGKGIAPGVVAKHIMECHLALSSPTAAIAQFDQWASNGFLTKEFLADLKVFLDDILVTKDMKNPLPQVENTPRKRNKLEAEQKKIALDIYSVKIRLGGEDNGYHEVDFNVTFQANDTISVVLPSNKRNLLNQLDLGMLLPEIQFYTPVAVFNGKGVITEKTEIKIGPKKGDYILDIKVKAN
jgi:hypothetical protein